MRGNSLTALGIKNVELGEEDCDENEDVLGGVEDDSSHRRHSMNAIWIRTPMILLYFLFLFFIGKVKLHC